ncbi:MAG: hypothetical protein A2X19_09725 [Bacteroidetes bacterium GWE2_39_28]|nr:MAG: hypothetical protein A2X19_09725 [Bacteroidetes bacterium GWE2_39_28]OFY12334.1 MAG: hypothetical protein A2X16_07040 [Bacteroidetes bacterium GWF2_39_10]OFZ11983.1 MAG: hypothetical protein A2465_08510 [Bacteroidetes bacterium RIFOXYC2_FULL_39_11]HCT95034.1 hypothetical protein [Rikenellaceae bacterium]
MTRYLPFIIVVFVLLVVPASLSAQNKETSESLVVDELTKTEKSEIAKDSINVNEFARTEKSEIAEKSNNVEFTANALLVSRYLWRGQDYGHAPSFQPGAELIWRGFTFGAWSALKIAGEGEPELDFYISKEVGKFTIALWDYWSYDKLMRTQYFDYNSATTSHMFEGQIIYSTGERNQFNLMLSSLFFGADPTKSLYGEVEYVREFRKNEIALVAGYQFKGEYYAQNSGFVNIGCSYLRYLWDFGKYSTFISFSLTANPALKKTFFAVAVGF